MGSSRRQPGPARRAIRKLEGDPGTQYRFHRFMARFWIANAVIVIAVYSLAPAAWGRASILYLALISLYSNWSTDAGAMSAADAATDEAITAHAIEKEDGDKDATREN